VSFPSPERRFAYPSGRTVAPILSKFRLGRGLRAQGRSFHSVREMTGAIRMRAQRPATEGPRIRAYAPVGVDLDPAASGFQAADGSGERFRLDRDHQCLWRQLPDAPEQRLLLAPKTFAVLQHLIDHAGRLVRLEEFLEVVWPGVCVQPEVLKSQILALRALLADDAHRPRFIETVPRRGYRFIARLSTASTVPVAIAPDASEPVRLVGRESALCDLHSILQQALRDRQREMVFVTGESGIGKTSLIDEFLRSVRQQMPQTRIALGQCVEGYGGKEPYYPMLEALQALCTGPRAVGLVRELASCAPSWLAQIPGLSASTQRPTLQRELLGGSRERMPRELTSLLQRLSRDAPVVLVFEDLQWADPFTVALLEVLARARAPMQLLLIGTYRAGELALGEHPLRALRQELQLHGLCEELPLPALTENEITTYLSGVPGAAPPEGLAGLIHRHTEGNPLFMVTLLEHLCQRGLLAKLQGRWQLHARLDTIEFEVPETLREMIDARVGRLSADEQALLEVASIIGVEFRPRWCADALGGDPERTEELCRALAERHCILRRSENDCAGQSPDEQSRYEFVHAMYREVLYRRQSAARRTGLHLKVGRALESASATVVSPQLAHILAYHFERGGRPQEVARYRSSAHDPAPRPRLPAPALPARSESTRRREAEQNRACA